MEKSTESPIEKPSETRSILHYKIPRSAILGGILALAIILLILVRAAIVIDQKDQQIRELTYQLQTAQGRIEEVKSNIQREQEDQQKTLETDKQQKELIAEIDKLIQKEIPSVTTDPTILTTIEPVFSREQCETLPKDASPKTITNPVRITPNTYGQVSIEDYQYVLRFFADASATTPHPSLSPISGNGCIFNEKFDIYWVSNDRVFVSFIGGHEAYPQTFMWLGEENKEWIDIYDFFETKFSTPNTEQHTPLTFKVAKNRFSLTETTYCCDIVQERYPKNWTEFIFDVKSLELIGAALHPRPADDDQN